MSARALCGRAAGRALGRGLALAAGVGLGACGGFAREPLLVWAALVAAPLGALTGRPAASGGTAPPLARVLVAGPPLAALLAPALLLGPPRPWAALALLGLFLLGRGVATVPRAAGVATAFGLLALGALLHGLPMRAGLGRAPWPPAVAARALDLSPTTLVMEAAGVDWLRRPALYGPAGGDSIGPSVRAPWPPALAAAVALMVGCGSLAVALVARRASMPCLRASSSARSPRN